MKIIDGKAVSAAIKEELTEKVARVKEKQGKVPGLVTILVGADPGSAVYVNMKNKACAKVGMHSKIEKYDADMPEQDLLDLVRQYNEDPDYHGILVQLPLPKHIDEDKVIEAIDPSKDVDGFHPVSVGKLVIGKEAFLPCTPYGIVELLKRYEIETKGKHVVVVGRSNIVGKPVANLLLQKKDGANAIVTVCHSASPDISYYTRQADILIAAVGRPDMIKADMVKEGAVIIDVGTNRVDDDTREKGYYLTGDVDFEDVKDKVSYISPSPGGVGPMTIAMLLSNTYKAFMQINKFEEE